MTPEPINSDYPALDGEAVNRWGENSSPTRGDRRQLEGVVPNMDDALSRNRERHETV